MIGMIAAVSQNAVIGLRGGLPWASHCYPGDLKRFRRVTLGSTVVMGRKTWESMSQRQLPGRECVVVRHDLKDMAELWPGFRFATSVDQAIADTAPGRDVWIIGGAQVYADGMAHAQVIDLTMIPFRIEDPNAVRFPNPHGDFQKASEELHPDEPTLCVSRWTRK